LWRKPAAAISNPASAIAVRHKDQSRFKIRMSEAANKDKPVVQNRFAPA